MKANDLHNFGFRKTGSGCYQVTYTTDLRGDYWVATVNDMTLIDATKNAEWARLRDIEWLRHIVITNGTHYNRYGERI